MRGTKVQVEEGERMGTERKREEKHGKTALKLNKIHAAYPDQLQNSFPLEDSEEM